MENETLSPDLVGLFWACYGGLLLGQRYITLLPSATDPRRVPRPMPTRGRGPAPPTPPEALAAAGFPLYNDPRRYIISRSTFAVGKSNKPLHFGTSQPRKEARGGDCGGAGGDGDNGGGEGPAPGRDPRADGGPVAAAPRADRPLRGRPPERVRLGAGQAAGVHLRVHG